MEQRIPRRVYKVRIVTRIKSITVNKVLFVNTEDGLTQKTPVLHVE